MPYEDWKFCLIVAMASFCFVVMKADIIAILLFAGYYYMALTIFNKEEVMSNNEKEFVAQDTKDLQIQSVCAFMEVFDYLLHIDGKFYHESYWDYPVKWNPYFKGCQIISFNNAVRLHNSWWDSFNYNFKTVECESFPEGSVFRADPYTYNRAKAAKIVKRAYLKGSSNGSIICHKHLVKFTDTAYHYIFLEDSK